MTFLWRPQAVHKNGSKNAFSSYKRNTIVWFQQLATIISFLQSSLTTSLSSSTELWLSGRHWRTHTHHWGSAHVCRPSSSTPHHTWKGTLKRLSKVLQYSSPNFAGLFFSVSRPRDTSRAGGRKCVYVLLLLCWITWSEVRKLWSE